MTRRITIAGLVSLVLWSLLSWLSHGIEGAPGNLANGFHYGVDNNAKPTAAYLGLHAALAGLLVWVLMGVNRDRLGRGLKWGVGLAIAFRLVLLPSVPIHESDFYRYLWDGKLAGSGINPFRFEPGALQLREKGITVPIEDPNVSGVFWKGRVFSAEESVELEQIAAIRDQNPELLTRVSHPAVPTIYPPLAQAVFGLSVALFGDSLAGLKTVILAFDLGVIAVVAGLLRRIGKNVLWVLAYAWNPLVLKEFANSAHYDAVPIFFTVLAVWLAISRRNQIATALALAGGTLAKYFSGILLPILIPPRPRNWILPLLFFGLVILAGFLPFVFWGRTGWARLFEGLGIYQARWHYNGGMFGVAFAILGDLAAAKLVCAGLFGGVLVFVIVRFRDRIDPVSVTRKAAVAMAALFVFSPTAFPWYFAWVLPFVCLFPSAAWLGLSFLLPFNYLDFHGDLAVNRLAFAGLPALWWLVWGGFVALLLAEALGRPVSYSRGSPRPGNSP